MNSIVKRVLSGAAALGIALSGLALGAASANADDLNLPKDEERTGTIYILNQSGSEQTHSFKGYRLAYLSNVEGQQGSNGGGKSATTVTLKTTFGINTTEAYKTAIENALKDVKASPTKTLYQQYTDKDNKDTDPMSWIASKVSNDAKEYPWGKGGDNGFAADGTSNEAVMRKLANALATELGKLNPAPAIGDNYKKDFKSGPQTTDSNGYNVPGYPNAVKAGLWLLVDNSGQLNGELGSGAMLLSSTYDKVPYESHTEGDNTQTGTVTRTTVVDQLGDRSLGHIVVKNSRPAVAKEVVKETSDSTASKPQYTSQDKPTYNIGDTVTYKLYTRIPVFNGYPYDPSLQNEKTTRQLKVNDFASRMLTVDKNNAVESVKLVPAGVDSNSNDADIVTLKAGTDYDVSTEPLTDQHRDDGPICTTESERKDSSQECTSGPSGHPNRYTTVYNEGTKTTISLDKYLNFYSGSTSAKAGKILEGYNVEIVFKAKLNANANVSSKDHVVANPNYVNLTFSNNASDCSQTGDDWGGEVNVYTFKFQIKKTNRSGAVLEGAQFVVKDTQKNMYLGGLNTSNEWTYAKYKTPAGRPTGDTTSPVAHVFTSNKDGMITGLTGLASGIYQVEEIEPPTGYTKIDLPKFNVTINANYQQDKSTVGQKFGFSTGDPEDLTKDLKWGDYTVGKQNVADNSYTFRVGIDAEQSTGTAGTVSIPSTGDYRISLDEKNTDQVNVINAKDISQLPLTGSFGIVLLLAVGVVLLGVSAALIIRSRKAMAASHAA